MFSLHGLVDGGDVRVALPSADYGAAAANGVWADLSNTREMFILFFLNAGASGNGPVIALEQATSSAGAGAKVLNLCEVHYQVNADVPTVSAWTQLAAIDRQNSVANYDTDAIGGDDEEIAVLIRVRAEDLDVNNGFSHVRLKTAAAGGNRTGFAVYIATGKFYQGQSLPTLIS